MRSDLLISAAALMVAGSAIAEQSTGEQVFGRVCAECHASGFGHPGTQRLGWKRGLNEAVLSERTDLVPEYVRYVVRHGLAEMPPLRPTEVSDQELSAVVAFLTGKRAASD